MDKSQLRRQAVRWLPLAVAIVAFVVVPILVGRDWAEVAVQAEAALGAAWFWAYRSRPRVTLKLGMRGLVYLDLENIGNRTAKHVRVRCDPPINIFDKDQFGPVEEFGDMDRGQRYEVAIGVPAKGIVAELERSTIEVSHESTWGLRRHKSTIQFGGAGLRRASSEDTSSPVGRIATAVGEIDRKLETIGAAVKVVGQQLSPPVTGGDGIPDKSCEVCEWDHFIYAPLMSRTLFRCANCYVDYAIGDECECPGMWCEHTPAPRQCTPSPPIVV